MAPRLFIAPGCDFSAARKKFLTASSSFCGTPLPYLYRIPRLFSPSGCPCSHDFLYHLTASSSFFGTPRPCWNMRPRLFWAAASPFKAAALNHLIASASFFVTPRPSLYRAPRLFCAPISPLFAARCINISTPSSLVEPLTCFFSFEEFDDSDDFWRHGNDIGLPCSVVLGFVEEGSDNGEEIFPASSISTAPVELTFCWGKEGRKAEHHHVFAGVDLFESERLINFSDTNLPFIPLGPLYFHTIHPIATWSMIVTLKLYRLMISLHFTKLKRIQKNERKKPAAVSVCGL
mmetsp:Transcript_3629/g.6386  ORF Transcript_3629/g.6386 Transcript_3629/m.6386 type:complete len:290 (+) Transcript_3629:1262-2131(+)